MDIWGNELRVLKVFTGGMILAKEMQKEDCWSSVMKKSCAQQTLGFIRHMTLDLKIIGEDGNCKPCT